MLPHPNKLRETCSSCSCTRMRSATMSWDNFQLLSLRTIRRQAGNWHYWLCHASSCRPSPPRGTLEKLYISCAYNLQHSLKIVTRQWQRQRHVPHCPTVRTTFDSSVIMKFCANLQKLQFLMKLCPNALSACFY